MAIAYNQSVLHRDNVVMHLDADNVNSYSPNVYPYPLDLYSWITGGYQQSISRETGFTSPAGGYPLKIITSGTSSYTSSYNNTSWSFSTASSGDTWTVSFWVKGSSNFQARIILFQANSAGNYLDAPTQSYNVTTEWQRVELTRTFDNSSTTHLQLRWDIYVSGVTMWIDGVQVERSSSATRFSKRQNVNRNNIYSLASDRANLVGMNLGTLNVTDYTPSFGGGNFTAETVKAFDFNQTSGNSNIYHPYMANNGEFDFRDEISFLSVACITSTANRQSIWAAIEDASPWSGAGIVSYSHDSNGKLSWWTDNGWWDSTISVGQNKWVMAAGTWSGTTQKLWCRQINYLGGSDLAVEEDTDSRSVSLFDDPYISKTNLFVLGDNGTSGSDGTSIVNHVIDGAIAKLIIWNKALTDGEVTAMMDSVGPKFGLATGARYTL